MQVAVLRGQNGYREVCSPEGLNMRGVSAADYRVGGKKRLETSLLKRVLLRTFVQVVYLNE